MMEGFELLLGHLVGDFILQNDWMSANKSNPNPGPNPYSSRSWITASRDIVGNVLKGDTKLDDGLAEIEWASRRSAWMRGHLACFVHCLAYTFAVFLTCWSWFPLWGYAVVFAAHFPVDRWRLARVWMERVSGQKAFATGPFSPWSIIVVDNIAHLLVLYAVAKVAL